MKFNVYRTSDYEYRNSVEINSLEELMDFVKKNERIIICPPSEYNEWIPEIEIYDDYRE